MKTKASSLLRSPWPWLVFATALALLVLMLFLRQRPEPRASSPPRSAAAPPVPVVLGPVELRDDALRLEALGSAGAARSVTLFSPVAGEVASIGFRAGQRVSAGQVLLQLDARRERLAVAEAEARLDAARRLLQRHEATRGTGAVPGSVIDETAAQARLADIALAQAREALADRTLRAPFAGVVGLSEVEAGDRIDLTTPVTTLDDRRRVQVAFELPETWAVQVRTGHRVTVLSPALPERPFDGRVVEIDSRVDPVARTARLRAEVPNPEDLLRPGMSFTVRLDVAGGPRPAVPALAVQWGRRTPATEARAAAGDDAFVWVVRQGLATGVPVRVLRRQGEWVLVDGALKAGERVVVEGVQRLGEGRAVAVPSAASAASAASASIAPAGVAAR